VGEREWREVIEQQRQVLEEVLKVQESIQRHGLPAKSQASHHAQINFSNALNDF